MSNALSIQPYNEDEGLSGIAEQRANTAGFFQASSHRFGPVKKTEKRVGASKSNEAVPVDIQTRRLNAAHELGENLVSVFKIAAFPNAGDFHPGKIRAEQKGPSLILPVQKASNPAVSLTKSDKKNDDFRNARLRQATLFGGPGSPFGPGKHIRLEQEPEMDEEERRRRILSFMSRSQKPKGPPLN